MTETTGAVSKAIGIREATDADLPSILEIVNREIHESPFVWRDEPITLEQRREWFKQHVAMKQPIIVACNGAGAVIGWASLSTFRAASGYRFTCEVSVYVARESHGHGIGRRLIERLHDYAHDMGLIALLAVIDCENAPSIRLFESLGYAEAGRLEDIGRKFDRWRGEVFLLKHLGKPASQKAG